MSGAPPTQLPLRPGIDAPSGGGGSASVEELAAQRNADRARFEETGEFPAGRWQYHCFARKTWVNVGDAEDDDLKRAFLGVRRQARITYKVHAVPYEADLVLLRRKNLASGRLYELRYDGTLPFDPPLGSEVDRGAGDLRDLLGDDTVFVGRRAAEAAGWSAEEVRSRLATGLHERDAGTVADELEMLVGLLDGALSYQQCLEQRLGVLAKRARDLSLPDDEDGRRLQEAAATVIKKIFRLSQGGTARLVSDVIVKS